MGRWLGPGYAVEVFRTPRGWTFAGLCILCLSRGALLNKLDGRPHVLFHGLFEFAASRVQRREGGGWRLA